MTWSELAGLTEPERRALAAEAMQTYRQAHRERSLQRGDAFLAMLSTATLAEIKKAPLTWSEAGVYDVLAARRPAWLGDWCEWVLGQQGWAWNVVRRMVREGLCTRPASDMYYLRLIEAGAHTPKQFLLNDPGLLEVEIWELFRIEGNSQLSLSGIEKYGHKDAWVRTFVELSAEGKISRARLLDSSLDALDCDFHQFRAGWFSRFHEALEPTLDERAARSSRYLRLIASRIPPTVTLALKAVHELCGADLVSPADVQASLSAAFYAKEKGTVTLALKLLEHCVRADLGLGPSAAASALPALEHASADVREAALGFITRQGVAVPAASAATPERAEAPPPLAKDPVAPILTLEELTLEFSKAIENEGPPEDLERVLDGVSRLCALRPPDFVRLTSPLARRAEHFLQRSTRGCFRGFGVRPLFCGLAKAWLSGEVPESNGEPAPGLGGFLGARVREVAVRAGAGIAQPLMLPRADGLADERQVEFGWHRRDNNYHETRIQIEPPLPKVIAVDQPELRAYTTRCESAEMLRWAATVCPGNREGWFTAGCRAIGNNLDWWSAEWQNRVYLEPLLEPAQPMGKMGLILISLGLAAKEAGEGTLAADVLAAAITDGRMTDGVCGEMLARLFSWEHIKMARVVSRLGQVARFSQLHQGVIREGIAAGLAEIAPPAGALGAVLELFHELSIATKSPPPQGKLRELLMAQAGGNRAAVVARKLLSLQK